MPYPIDPLGSGLYTLQAWQRKAFIFTCDIYGLPTFTGLTGSPAGNYIKMYTNVPAYYEVRREFDRPSGLGLSEEIGFRTLDFMHFHIQQPIQNGQRVIITAVPSWMESENGLNLEVIGGAVAQGFLAYKLSVAVKKMPVGAGAWHQ